MKDITNKIDGPASEKIHEEREARKENKMIGSLRQKKGHRMYKIHDGVLSELTDADYFDTEIQVSSGHVIPWINVVDEDGNRIRPGNRRIYKHKTDVPQNVTKSIRKIRIEPNTDYFSALNAANAVKHCKKMNYVVRLIEI